MAALDSDSFQVSIIPHTGSETILLGKKAGDVVNLENDIIGKYVQRLLTNPAPEEAPESKVTWESWRKTDFRIGKGGRFAREIKQTKKQGRTIAMSFKYNTVEEALEALRAGKLILCTDDPDRENEGDLICAAEHATTENVNFMATHAKG